MVGIVGPIGTQELIIILVIALVIFGPKRLPELGRSLGKGIKEFKKSTSELTEHITGGDEEEAAKTEQAATKTEEAATVEKAPVVKTPEETVPVEAVPKDDSTVNAEAESPKTEAS